MSTPAVDFWDLDHTLFSREPIVHTLHDRLAAVAECDRIIVDEHARSFSTSFTLQKLFSAINLPEEKWEEEEKAWLGQMSLHALECIPAGMISILAERSKVARQVLVTMAIPEWQRKKVAALTPLHQFFSEEDRHYVSPDGSKGEIIARYAGVKTFIDDSPSQLRDALAHTPDITLIRPMWPSEHRAADPDDGKLWKVATNAEELRACFTTATI